MGNDLFKSRNTLLVESITVRPFNLSDVDDLMILATDEMVLEFCDWNCSDFTSKDYVAKYIAEQLIPHPYYRAICINDRPIGDISVEPKAGWESCGAEISYIVASDYWGKGIATKAVKMVVSKIFDEWPDLKRIEGIVDVENKASQRVLEKCGFKREGVLRKYFIYDGKAIDVVMFSLLSNEV